MLQKNKWGLDWGLGIGDWGLGPKPPTPTPNPPTPTPKLYIKKLYNK